MKSSGSAVVVLSMKSISTLEKLYRGSGKNGRVKPINPTPYALWERLLEYRNLRTEMEKIEMRKSIFSGIEESVPAEITFPELI